MVLILRPRSFIGCLAFWMLSRVVILLLLVIPFGAIVVDHSVWYGIRWRVVLFRSGTGHSDCRSAVMIFLLIYSAVVILFTLITLCSCWYVVILCSLMLYWLCDLLLYDSVYDLLIILRLLRPVGVPWCRWYTPTLRCWPFLVVVHYPLFGVLGDDDSDWCRWYILEVIICCSMIWYRWLPLLPLWYCSRWWWEAGRYYYANLYITWYITIPIEEWQLVYLFWVTVLMECGIRCYSLVDGDLFYCDARCGDDCWCRWRYLPCLLLLLIDHCRCAVYVDYDRLFFWLWNRCIYYSVFRWPLLTFGDGDHCYSCRSSPFIDRWCDTLLLVLTCTVERCSCVAWVVIHLRPVMEPLRSLVFWAGCDLWIRLFDIVRLILPVVVAGWFLFDYGDLLPFWCSRFVWLHSGLFVLYIVVDLFLCSFSVNYFVVTGVFGGIHVLWPSCWWSLLVPCCIRFVRRYLRRWCVVTGCCYDWVPAWFGVGDELLVRTLPTTTVHCVVRWRYCSFLGGTLLFCGWLFANGIILIAVFSDCHVCTRCGFGLFCHTATVLELLSCLVVYTGVFVVVLRVLLQMGGLELFPFVVHRAIRIWIWCPSCDLPVLRLGCVCGALPSLLPFGVSLPLRCRCCCSIRYPAF